MAAWAGLLTVGQLAAVALLAGVSDIFFATAYQVCLLWIRAGTPRPAKTERTMTPREEIATGARFIARDRCLCALTIYAAVANLAYAGYTSLVVVFLVRVAGLGTAAVPPERMSPPRPAVRHT